MSDDFEQIIRHFAKSSTVYHGPMAFRERCLRNTPSPNPNPIPHMLHEIFSSPNTQAEKKHHQHKSIANRYIDALSVKIFQIK